LVGKITWDLFLFETREIFLTFFSLLYHFLIVKKEMQLCRQFTMVKSQSGEILILISNKKSSAMSEKSNIQKKKKNG
jgi:hypothetical protein